MHAQAAKKEAAAVRERVAQESVDLQGKAEGQARDVRSKLAHLERYTAKNAQTAATFRALLGGGS